MPPEVEVAKSSKARSLSSLLSRRFGMNGVKEILYNESLSMPILHPHGYGQIPTRRFGKSHKECSLSPYLSSGNGVYQDPQRRPSFIPFSLEKSASKLAKGEKDILITLHSSSFDKPMRQKITTLRCGVYICFLLF